MDVSYRSLYGSIGLHNRLKAEDVKSVMITSYDATGMKPVDVAMPEPGPSQVRLRVHTAGVAFADVLKRRHVVPGNPKLPFVPGFDIVGTIDKVGANVRGFSVGARVAALIGVGGYAEYACADASSIVSVPDAVLDVDAVAATLNYGTAYQLLHSTGHVKSGDTILVPGAGGSVGTAMLQLAALAGVRAIGLAATAKHALVGSFGGEPVDDRTANVKARVMQLTQGKGVDVAYDSTGGASLQRARSVVRRGGRVASFGFSSMMGRDGSVHKSVMFGSLASIALMKLTPGVHVSVYVSESKGRRASFMRDVAAVFDLIATGKLKPVIAQVFPLEAAARAHAMLESGKGSGKVVLQVAER